MLLLDSTCPLTFPLREIPYAIFLFHNIDVVFTTNYLIFSFNKN
jgi:hypothetical protein